MDDCIEISDSDSCPSPVASEREIFKCGSCSEKFRFKAMLDRHMWTHTSHDHECTKRCPLERLLQCDYCDKVVPCMAMERHVSLIHEHESFCCVVCEKYDMTPEAYTQHVFQAHSKGGRERHERQKFCAKCDEIAEVYRFDLTVNYFCDYCILVRPRSRSQRLADRSFAHVCHLCSKVYSSESLLEDHLMSHRAPKYICVHCHRIFVNSAQHEKHTFDHEIKRKRSHNMSNGFVGGS